MFDFIRLHQLNIMLILCGACGILVFLLIITRFITKRRKAILIFMEVVAFFLLWFDRLAYIYAGAPGQTAFVMVRVSNFMVFFLTPAIVLGFNLYLIDLPSFSDFICIFATFLLTRGSLRPFQCVFPSQGRLR